MKFIVQSRPDAQGVRTFFSMDTDPRRAPYAARLRDEFLTKVGTSREWDVVASCYDVNADALLAAGAVVVARLPALNFSAIPGDFQPGAWEWQEWYAEFLGIA